jgi:hypothetical protein
MTAQERKIFFAMQKAIAEFQERHVEDYIDSPTRTKVIKDYLASKNLPVTLDNLEEAFKFAVASGADMKSPVSRAEAEVQHAKIKAVDALPKIPDHMPQIKNRADLRAVDGNQFKELRIGKHGKQWMARVQAVLSLPEESK